MPSNYAHYRFGAQLLPTLPAETQRTVKRFRRMYDVGLHGPDLFFYYNPFLQTRTGALGGKFHEQSGREFFGRVARTQRLDPSEAGLAYLYGVLCHYTLDSICHPFVRQKTLEGPAGHSEMETEFDRFLLEKDGKVPPHAQDMSLHMQLTPGECQTVAAFYPPARRKQIQDCVKNMAFFTRLLASPEGAWRTVLKKGTGFIGGTPREMLMTTGPNPRCEGLDGELLALYDRAMARYPEMLRQLQAHLAHNAPLGEEFAPNFG